MFLCEKCTPKEHQWYFIAMLLSRGKCEDCGEPSICADVPCSQIKNPVDSKADRA